MTSDTAAAVIGIETKLGAEEAGRLRFGAKLWDIAALPGFAPPVLIPLRQALNWRLQAVDRALTATALVDHLRV